MESGAEPANFPRGIFTVFTVVVIKAKNRNTG
jgi:hypothetical protein